MGKYITKFNENIQPRTVVGFMDQIPEEHPYVILYKNYGMIYKSVTKYPDRGGFSGFGVDLGLPSNTLWGSYNLYANNPEEWGNSYAWGELESKESYSWDNYRFGTQNNITKYNSTDGITQLQLEDDIVNLTMGHSWVIPSSIDFYELFSYCTSTSEMINNQYCYKFTSNINGNYIIIPVYEGEYYWTSSLQISKESAYAFTGDSVTSNMRYKNYHIRPVCKPTEHIWFNKPSVIE